MAELTKIVPIERIEPAIVGAIKLMKANNLDATAEYNSLFALLAEVLNIDEVRLRDEMAD